MPACVYREDLKLIFNQAIDKFSKKSGTSYSKKKKAIFLQMLRDEINRIPGKNISERFLQKKMVSEVLNNFRETVISIDLDDLNALYAYVKGNPDAEYEKDYLISNDKRSLILAKLDKISPMQYKLHKLKGVEFPEFPVENQNYPANPNIPFYYKNFQRIWIKDESHNVTGTFKDRWAWEILKYYYEILEEFKKSKQPLSEIPRLCLISTGCAAVSLQYLLKKYRLPDLRVIVDSNIDSEIRNALKNLGAAITKFNLDDKELSSRDIKRILDAGENDIDITLLNENETLQKRQFEFYDWLALEILNQNPDYCFIPFGSGLLFYNILEMAKKEIKSEGKGESFLGDYKKIMNCTFYGAKPTDGKRDTLLDKLYSKYNPNFQFTFRDYKGLYCNEQSDIIEVEEAFVMAAMNLCHDYQEHVIISEPSGLAGLSLFLQMENQIPPDAKIVIVNTGKLKSAKFTG